MDDSSYIEAFLTTLKNRAPDDWRFEHYERGFWFVEHKGWAPPCQFFIELGPHAVYLYTRLDIRIWAECRLGLYRYILRLNEETSNAKFGLSPNGIVSLMAEWPRDNLTFASFEQAVQVLLAYHRAYYQDIKLVAQDVDLARQVAASELQELNAEKAVQVKVEQSMQHE